MGQWRKDRCRRRYVVARHDLTRRLTVDLSSSHPLTEGGGGESSGLESSTPRFARTRPANNSMAGFRRIPDTIVREIIGGFISCFRVLCPCVSWFAVRRVPRERERERNALYPVRNSCSLENFWKLRIFFYYFPFDIPSNISRILLTIFISHSIECI